MSNYQKYLFCALSLLVSSQALGMRQVAGKAGRALGYGAVSVTDRQLTTMQPNYMSMSQAQQQLFLIEGNIGAGKSTFLQMLSNHFPQAVCIPEPCDKWQNIQGHNLLDAFYKDTKRWAYSMLSYVMMTVVQQFQNSVSPAFNLYFMERSLYSGKYCFFKNLTAAGMLNNLEQAMYANSWDWFNKQMPKPRGIIYLQTNPEVCHNRMKARARAEEDVVSLEYLQTLHDRHENWLVSKEWSDKEEIPVLTLNACLDFKNDIEVQKQFVKLINDFMQNEGQIKLPSETRTSPVINLM
jgi:deoxyadenosine/deoxycytidine kinase